MSGVYEQIKDDLGYLQMDRAVEVFAILAEQARSEDLSHVEFLARLVGEQANATRNRRLTARLRYARFPFRKTIDEFDFQFQPTVERKLVDDLATLRFMETGRPILFLGQPGCGKTHLAVAIATRGALDRLDVDCRCDRRPRWLLRPSRPQCRPRPPAATAASRRRPHSQTETGAAASVALPATQRPDMGP